MPDPHPPLTFTLTDLDQWADAGLLTPDQAYRIRQHVDAAAPPAGPERRRGFNFISVAYYFGAFMILLAYTVFMGLRWEGLSPGGQVAVSGLSVAVLWAVGYGLRRGGFRVAGGLLIFAGTGIAPLFFYAAQRALGWWPPERLTYSDFYRQVSPYWVLLECASLGVAVLVLLRVRFTLLTLLLAFWTWYLSMDLARLSFGSQAFAWSDREQLIGLAVGVGLLGVGVLLQRRTRQDYSLWFYLFGHLLILTHLSYFTLQAGGWLGLAYLLVYLAFVVLSIQLQRRVFLVFGALGCYGYLCYLAFEVFAGTLGFVFALAGLGLVIVLTAVGYQQYVRPWLARGLGQPPTL